MLTSTIAWCTPCVERARRAYCFTLWWHRTPHGSSPEQTLCHPRSYSWRTLLDSTSPFFLYFSFLSFSVYFLHNELFLELDNPIVMESLCYSAAEKSEGTLNASHSFTGYEPNLLTFGELYDSSVPFSLMIPSADQDVDDPTLGEMLTAAHRGQADYCVPGGMSVSQSSSSVMFDGSGQPDGERNVDQSVNFGVTRFSEDIQTVRMVDGSGQPDERNSSKTQIRTLLGEQRQTIIAEYREKGSHHELHAAHAEEERRLLQGQLWRQKLEFREAHNKVLQRWKNYGNSRVLPSIRSRDENSSRIRTLFWNYQAEYRNCKMK